VFTPCFQREEGGIYACHWYDATLQKALDLGGEEDRRLSALEVKMQAIDWRSFFKVGECGEDLSLHCFEVLETLSALEQSEKGVAVAQQLKWKYWQGTPLEVYCGDTALLKGSYTVWQRFFLFRDEPPITLSDAYRFLSHRWRVRRLSPKKGMGGMDGVAPAGKEKGKVLKKKRGGGLSATD
jgi:hypothetical protein